MHVRNRLAVLMAERGIRSLSALQRMIQDNGDTIARRTLDKFYNNESNRVDYETIVSICKVLQCDIGDLLVLEESGEE